MCFLTLKAMHGQLNRALNPCQFLYKKRKPATLCGLGL